MAFTINHAIVTLATNKLTATYLIMPTSNKKAHGSPRKPSAAIDICCYQHACLFQVPLVIPVMGTFFVHLKPNKKGESMFSMFRVFLIVVVMRIILIKLGGKDGVSWSRAGP